MLLSPCMSFDCFHLRYCSGKLKVIKFVEGTLKQNSMKVATCAFLYTSACHNSRRSPNTSVFHHILLLTSFEPVVVPAWNSLTTIRRPVSFALSWSIVLSGSHMTNMGKELYGSRANYYPSTQNTLPDIAISWPLRSPTVLATFREDKSSCASQERT